MPVDIKWYCEGQVIYAQYSGDMSIADVSGGLAQTVALIESSDVPLVHTIADLTGVEKHPPLGELLRHFKLPPRSGWSLVIGLSNRPIVRFFVQVMATSIRLRHREVDSFDDALAFLQKMDSTLPDLRAYQHTAEERSVASG